MEAYQTDETWDCAMLSSKVGTQTHKIPTIDFLYSKLPGDGIAEFGFLQSTLKSQTISPDGGGEVACFPL